MQSYKRATISDGLLQNLPYQPGEPLARLRRTADAANSWYFRALGQPNTQAPTRCRKK
jgi:hypothetical protein